MDESLARLIRDTPADLITLKLGINVHNMGSHGGRSFGQAVLGNLLTIREKHPKTPLLLVSPIFGAWREEQTHSPSPMVPDTKNPTDARFLNLKQMRTELKRIVELLRKRGDEQISYLDGLELF